MTTDGPALPAVGVDLVDCARIRRILERNDGAFVARVFTDGEQAYCKRMAEPAPHYAARFAAKEAVAKALGTGIGAGAAMREIEVVRNASGAPGIVLHGSAAATAAALGVAAIKLSLSHTGDNAIAMVMLVYRIPRTSPGPPGRPRPRWRKWDASSGWRRRVRAGRCQTTR